MIGIYLFKIRFWWELQGSLFNPQASLFSIIIHWCNPKARPFLKSNEFPTSQQSNVLWSFATGSIHIDVLPIAAHSLLRKGCVVSQIESFDFTKEKIWAKLLFYDSAKIQKYSKYSEDVENLRERKDIINGIK